MNVVEVYEPVVIGREAPQDPRIAHLIWWGARFAELGFSPSYGPGDHGNLSFRTADGLVMTARQTAKARLQAGDFVEVLKAEGEEDAVKLRCRGPRLPSTDAWMHLRIYAARPDIHAILHGHDPSTLAKAGALHLPMTQRSANASSRELVEEVVSLAGENDYLLLRDHGFIALGPTIDEAGELVRSLNARARS